MSMKGSNNEGNWNNLDQSIMLSSLRVVKVLSRYIFKPAVCLANGPTTLWLVAEAPIIRA